MVHKNTVLLKMPLENEWVSVAGSAAMEYSITSGFTASDALRVRLALEESILYAISLSYGKCDDTLLINFSQTALGLRLSVRSRGLPLEERLLPRFDAARLSSQGDMTGVGPLLAQKMVDKAEFSVLENGEREIVLLKSLPFLDNDKGADPPPPPVTESPEENIDAAVRLATPDDAESISRLAFRAHGDILFSQQIYYPASVREMLEQGVMTSFIAETADGQTVAHSALVKQVMDALTEEMSFGFTDERFRGRGLLGEIIAAQIENATTRGVRVLTAPAVTNHVNSQRAGLLAGFREGALLLASSPASRFRGEDRNGSPNRIACLLLNKYLESPSGEPCYIPGKHRDMVERIFLNLGITLQHSNNLVSHQGKTSRITALSDYMEGGAMLFIQSYGVDICRQLLSQTELFSAQNISTLELFLPLALPETSCMCEQFEAMGFFFGGIGTGLDGRPNLILQRLNNVEPSYDAIKTHTAFGRELLNYVRLCHIGIDSPGFERLTSIDASETA